MTPARLFAFSLLAASLAGCQGLGLKSGGEGVFEPTAMQPPPSERGAGLRSTESDTPETPASTARPRTLAVPAR
jgi:hypothetical protein